ncbi:MAG: 50S ribosome-binding GTPase, partial [Chloroflexi bacterium]|nr:50S ribosome-binding GTPase [Chloroflexota bacterium]
MKTTTTPLPIVAIVGRPNVGKSALFNRIVGGRPALVEDLPGTTRDRIYGDAHWRGRDFTVVDTGGLEPDVPGTYTPLIRQQVEQALDEAEMILFVVDTITGITAAEYEVADLLRRTHKPVLLLANKVENREREDSAVAFFELGLGEPIAISAHHGHGVWAAGACRSNSALRYRLRRPDLRRQGVDQLGLRHPGAGPRR